MIYFKNYILIRNCIFQGNTLSRGTMDDKRIASINNCYFSASPHVAIDNEFTSWINDHNLSPEFHAVRGGNVNFTKSNNIQLCATLGGVDVRAPIICRYNFRLTNYFDHFFTIINR